MDGWAPLNPIPDQTNLGAEAAAEAQKKIHQQEVKAYFSLKSAIAFPMV